MNEPDLFERLVRVRDSFGRLAAATGVRGVLAAWTPDGSWQVCADEGPDRPIDADTPFPLGSLTKLFTATAVAALVSRRAVELDRPVGEYVPEFRLPDRTAARAMTVRRLLAHTSGLRNGELFLDDQPEPDSLAELVARTAAVRTFLVPGEIYSYSGTGYVVLGRLVEVVTGMVWPAALTALVLEPLGLRNTFAYAELLPSQLRPLGATSSSRATGPSDQIWSTANDLLRLGQLHVDSRPTPLRAVVSDAAIAEMRVPVAPLPDPAVGWASGLGWRIFDEAGSLVGHWGQTRQEAVALWVAGPPQLAVALVGEHRDLARAQWLLLDLCGRLFAPLLVYRSAEDVEDAPPLEHAAAGTYELPSARFRVSLDEAGTLAFACEPLRRRPTLFDQLRGAEFRLQPSRHPGDAVAVAEARPKVVVRFRAPADGRYRYLHLWGQTALRVG